SSKSEIKRIPVRSTICASRTMKHRCTKSVAIVSHNGFCWINANSSLSCSTSIGEKSWLLNMRSQSSQNTLLAGCNTQHLSWILKQDVHQVAFQKLPQQIHEGINQSHARATAINLGSEVLAHSRHDL